MPAYFMSPLLRGMVGSGVDPTEVGPVLTDAVAEQLTETSLSISVITDTPLEGNGYLQVVAGATPPDASDVVAGIGGVFNDIVPVAGTVINFIATGLTDGVAYYAYVVQLDFALNASNLAAALPVTIVVTPEITVSNQTVYIGGKTLANAKGLKPYDSDGNEVNVLSLDSVVSGTGTLWARDAASNSLYRSSTPAASHGAILRITTDLGQIDVTINSTGTDSAGNNMAVSYSVSTFTELKAAAEVSGATIAGLNLGDNILLRTGLGEYNVTQTAIIQRLTVPYGTFTMPSLKDPEHPDKGSDLDTANFVKITKHVGAHPVIGYIRFNGFVVDPQYFRLSHLEFHQPSLAPGSANSVAIRIDQDCTHIAVDHCDVWSDLDDALAYNARTNSAILVGGRYMWIHDNDFHHCHSGFGSTVSTKHDDVEVVGNTFRSMVENYYNGRPGDNNLISWNWFKDYRDGNSALSLHADYMQFADQTLAGSNLRVIGNRFQLGAFPMTDPTKGAQGIFGGPRGRNCTASMSGTTLTVSSIIGDGNPINVGDYVSGLGVIEETQVTARLTGTGGTGTYSITPAQTVGSRAMSCGQLFLDDCVIAGNILVTNARNTLTMSHMRGGRISNNTVMADPECLLFNQLLYMTACYGTEVSYNLYNFIGEQLAIVATTFTDNLGLALSDYATYFADPQAEEDIADPSIEYAIIDGSPADLQTPVKAGAHPDYVDFVNRETFFPWETDDTSISVYDISPEVAYVAG